MFTPVDSSVLEEITLVPTATDESSILVVAELLTVGDAIGMAVGDTEADVDRIDESAELEISLEATELAANCTEDITELDVAVWAVFGDATGTVVEADDNWIDNSA